ARAASASRMATLPPSGTSGLLAWTWAMAENTSAPAYGLGAAGGTDGRAARAATVRWGGAAGPESGWGRARAIVAIEVPAGRRRWRVAGPRRAGARSPCVR